MLWVHARTLTTRVSNRGEGAKLPRETSLRPGDDPVDDMVTRKPATVRITVLVLGPLPYPAAVSIRSGAGLNGRDQQITVTCG
jgi:hypothetical protein